MKAHSHFVMTKQFVPFECILHVLKVFFFKKKKKKKRPKIAILTAARGVLFTI